eukprot:TRINITY_DN24280_c0_g1_i4.p1 TRINITY_DN24280_c0_g1~~TRINITY_DN24280_c0_g1_i4.p1  ORF type:complete len:421 (+),score=78.07 TRINITY_DN24280_c0_g1_i4:108-1370(+)
MLLLGSLRCFELAILASSFATCFVLTGAPIVQSPQDWEASWSATSEAALLEQLEAAVGRDFRLRAESRLQSIEASLEPIYNSLPKNQNGRLGRQAVRYVLRRLLLRRHAWVLGGLQSTGDNKNSSWISAVLVPEVVQSNATYLSGAPVDTDSDCYLVQSLFERSIAKAGADLAELAVLAAAIEQSVHSDLRGKLKIAYRIRSVSPDGQVNAKKADDLVDLTIMSFVRGRNISSWSSELVQEMEATIESLYPPWPEFQPVMRQVREDVFPGKSSFDFEDLAFIVKEIGERFGDWNDKECHADKRSLLEMEDGHSGRVRLVDYYDAALRKGKYQFSENLNYLKQSGILDESDPLVPRVIISNYILSPSNCMARTEFYSVCCRDECEDLLTHVEAAIAAPEGSAGDIAAIQRGSWSLQARRQM